MTSMRLSDSSRPETREVNSKPSPVDALSRNYCPKKVNTKLCTETLIKSLLVSQSRETDHDKAHI
jgi:hypothetical protein